MSSKSAAVIGLTGPFGVGCTTAAKHLGHSRDYQLIRLSEVVKARWGMENEGKIPTRGDLQHLGDVLRQDAGNGALVDLALESHKATSLEPPRLVIDGIRNTGEVLRLQELFGSTFTLMAVVAPQADRWERIQSLYLDGGHSLVDFLADDRRDRNEEVAWGQQVELCIDLADVIVYNGEDRLLKDFKAKVAEFADLVSGDRPRHPTQEEIWMNMAYSSRHGSKCAKRHVGAVVVTGDGHVSGVGYNENPLGTLPCIEEPAYGKRCYRDIVRNDHFSSLSLQGALCPVCSTLLPAIEGPPWRCPTCLSSGRKTNLEDYFFPDRAMSWCTAIHAEVWAILAAGQGTRGATLYTTTFPCFQCAEKIIHSGIEDILFTEVYSDVKSAARLDLAGVTYQQFEGVRSSNFERIFSSIQPV